MTGGEITGPRMRGRPRSVGGDWLSLRPDGTSVLDVRATLELEDGALIDASYGGPADLDPDGWQRFLVGNPPAPVASPSHRDITPVMQRISG